jgi:hypothetical protein
MPRGATPSRWCVYQFHHVGTNVTLVALNWDPELLSIPAMVSRMAFFDDNKDATAGRRSDLAL